MTEIVKAGGSFKVSKELLWDTVPTIPSEVRVPAFCAGPIMNGDVKDICGMALEGGFAFKITKKGRLRLLRYPRPCRNAAHLFRISST